MVTAGVLSATLPSGVHQLPQRRPSGLLQWGHEPDNRIPKIEVAMAGARPRLGHGLLGAGLLTTALTLAAMSATIGKTDYLRVTFAGELEGAHSALAASGIETSIPTEGTPADPVDSVLA